MRAPSFWPCMILVDFHPFYFSLICKYTNWGSPLVKILQFLVKNYGGFLCLDGPGFWNWPSPLWKFGIRTSISVKICDEQLTKCKTMFFKVTFIVLSATKSGKAFSWKMSSVMLYFLNMEFLKLGLKHTVIAGGSISVTFS